MSQLLKYPQYSLRELLMNTPQEVKARARNVGAIVMEIKKRESADFESYEFVVRCKAITEKVYYDIRAELFPVIKNRVGVNKGEEPIFQIPSLWHPVIVNCSCFTGDTLIPLADGKSVPIKDLVNKDKFYVYSYDVNKKKNVIGKGFNCEVKEKNAKLYEVLLDNGQKIKCTGDHKFLLRDGETYKEAKDLIAGESLQALYRRSGSDKTTKNYEQLLQTDGWEFTHRIADQYNIENNVYDKSCGQVRHHIDFNKANNSPENIKRMPWYKHLQIHKKHMLGDGNPMRRELVKKKVKETSLRNGSYKKTSERMRTKNPMHSSSSLEKMMLTSKSRGLTNSDRVKNLHKLRKGDAWKKNVSIAQKRLIANGKHIGLTMLIESNRIRSKLSTYHTKSEEFKKVLSERNLKLSVDGKHPFQLEENRKKMAAVSSLILSNKEEQKKRLRQRAIKTIRVHLLEFGKIIPDKFKFQKGNLTYNYIKNNFDLDEIVKEATNHKVVSVLELDKREDVYCFTVEKYNNFVIDVDGGKEFSSGVVVHNCPFYLYNCEWVLWQSGNARKLLNNGKPPNITNPQKIPYVCKHLVAASNQIIQAAKEMVKAEQED